MKGTQSTTYWYDDGLVGLCKGVNYKKTWHPGANDFVWGIDDDKPKTSFNPKNCGIKELEKWAKEHNCP